MGQYSLAPVSGKGFKISHHRADVEAELLSEAATENYITAGWEIQTITAWKLQAWF